MADAPPSGSRSRLARASGVIGGVLAVVASALVVRTLASEWDRVREELADADWAWMGVGLLLAALAMACIAFSWADVIRVLGDRVGRRHAMAWYFVGELGKYLPGGVWPVVGRGELARRGGIPRSRAYAGVALSLGTLYLAAMFVAVLLLPFALADGGELGSEALLLLLLPLGLAALHPRVLDPVLRLARRVTKRDLPVHAPPWKQSAAVVARYAPAWLFVGAATFAVAHAVDPDAPAARVMFAAVLSWIAGFLAVPVPAGAGIRELVFVAASGLDPGLGATVAIASRILFIVVDGVGALVGAPFLRHRGEDIEIHDLETGTHP